MDDDSLAKIMSLGYSATEARLGLRSSGGNLNLAVQYILQWQEEKKERAAKEAEEEKRRWREKRLGKTKAGEWVNGDRYEALRSMGFSASQARRALKQSNNDIYLAVQIIQDSLAGSTSSSSSSSAPMSADSVEGIPESRLAELLAMGLNIDVLNKALSRNNGDVEAALSELMGDDDLGGRRDDGKEREAMERLTQDIANNEEDFLDVTLAEESVYLKEYQDKLMSLGF